ncbi:MAG: twin-arginine translocation signal domain-containing protein, partial [Planctomycetota bacterium]|nr:twin-arginine translocation signal domain-containing protein [Planctomycetota bacterium]
MPERRQSDSFSASRRQFLKLSGTLAGAIGLPAFVSSSVFGAGDSAAPSNRLALGCIGMGIQGMGDMRTFIGNNEVKVVAVCDV